MKRILAGLLCVLLLLPTISTVAWAASGAYTPLATIPYAFNGSRLVDSRHEIFSYGATFDPIDLTAFGYPASGSIPAGKLGLQLDVCVSGADDVVEAIAAGQISGQLEITSSGTCDVEELGVSPSQLEWEANVWSRTVIDLAAFGKSVGTFDPTGFDYMRMYIFVPASCAYQSAHIKVANVQIVDLTKPLDTAPPIGDGTAGDELSSYDNPYTAPAYKELAVFPYTATVMSAASGEVIAVSGATDEGINLTQWGFPQSGLPTAGKLGIQFDYLVDGGENAVKLLANGMLNGQFEVTSSGACDKNEIATSVNRRLKGKAGVWTRNVMDFAWLTSQTGGAFDPTNFNYLRIYASVATDYPDERVDIRIRNVRVVDLTSPLSAAEAPPLGDGTFVMDAPRFEVQKPAPAFVTDTAVVAGYNLKTYAETHGLSATADWTPLIQSLLYALARQGGGALYIPAGIYPCYGEITVPTGVTLQGDWVNPDTAAASAGTVLAAYGETGAAPFVTLCNNSYLRSMAFWYPEQSFESPKYYPYTISMGTTTHIKDITLVNAYSGITFRGGSCPDMENVYGTPLSVGLDLDMVTDSYGMENVHFAPDYWENSALAGAPTLNTEKKALRDHLYENATGLIIRRMDWSWTTYSSVKGYAVGLRFAKSGGGNWYPNGQCYALQFEGCHTALYAEGVGGAGMVLNGITVRDCVYGIRNVGTGKLTVLAADIAAGTALAVENANARQSMLSSVVQAGAVTVRGGRLTVLDTVFRTNPDHITLEKGTQAALLAAVTDQNGNRVAVNNRAYCLLVQEDENPITEEMPVISREKGLYRHHRPASDAVTVSTLDNTGKTDVSAALNAALQAQAKTGGTVYLKPGFYRIDNPITVPTGVELLGSLDFGQAELCNGVGTILQIYHGKNQPNEATIILEAGAGLRGVQINYPEQNLQADGSFVPYAHTVQGRGANAYVINVSSRNSWSGVDFMTYRCDNHYIDSFRGAALQSFVAVGGGAENGVVRNCHLQYTSWTYGHQSRCGGWPRAVEGDSAAIEAWRMDLYIFAGHNLNNYTIGHVENQLHFGNMNYCGYTGINVVPEKTGLADVAVWGQNTDYSTVSMNVEAARRVDFINLQTTAFTWIAERQEKEMNLIHLGADCDITVNVFGAALYENPDYMFDVENGTLNIFGAAYMSSVPMTNLGKDGKVNLVDAVIGSYYSAFDKNPEPSSITAAVQNPQNLAVKYSFYTRPFTDASTVGTRHLYSATTVTRVDVAENMTVPQGAEVLYSEAFTNYAASSVKLGTVGSSVTVADGVATLQNSGSVRQTGLTAKNTLSLASGKTYRIELRLKVNSIRSSYGGKLLFDAYNQSGTAVGLWRIDNSKRLQVKNGYGWSNVGTLSTDTWYRISVELDMQAKTYKVAVYDTRYRLLLASNSVSLSATAVTGWQLLAETTLATGSDQTRAQLDYLAVMQGGTVEEDVSHTPAVIPAVWPTCTTGGTSEGVYCRICDEVLVAAQPLAATGHVAVTDPAISATCLAGGVSAGAHCAVCGEVLTAQQYTPVGGHVEAITPAVEPTCKQTGLTEGKHCAACGEVLVAQTVVKKVGHKAVAVKGYPATCTTVGLTDGKNCSVCGMVVVKQTEIPATGHTAVTVPAVAPTCGESGLTAGKRCTACGTVLVKQTVVPATGVHTWDNGVVTLEPTYEAAGVMTYTCTACDTTKTEVLPKLEAPSTEWSFTYTVADGKVTITGAKGNVHGDVVIPAVLEGCPVTAIANNAFRNCVNMTSVVIPESIETIGQYAFKDCTALTTVYYYAANCTSAGVNAYPIFEGCTALTTAYIGKTVTATAPRLFRAATALKTVYLTRNTKTISINTFYRCDTIETVYFVGTAGEFAELDIKSNNAALTDSANLFVYNAPCFDEHEWTGVCDSLCDLCRTKRATTHTNVVDDAAVAPTCDATGLTAGTHCTACGNVVVKQTVVQALGHAWDAGEVLTPPTDKADGEKTYTCTVCGDIKTVVLNLGEIIDGYYYYKGVLKGGVGLVQVEDALYYVTTSGAVKTGRYTLKASEAFGIAAGTYYFFEDGKLNLAKGVYEGKYYNEKGMSEAYAGLVEVKGAKYYIQAAGNVTTGRYFISKLNGLMSKKQSFTFFDDGRMLEDTRIYKDGFYYENGLRIPYAGLVEYEGGYYYVGDSGKYMADKRYLVSNLNNTGKTKGYYYFDTDGTMLFNVVRDNRYYGADGMAPYNAGVVEVDGKLYYNNGTHGALRVNATFTVTAAKTNGLCTAGQYTADANGVLTKVS